MSPEPSLRPQPPLAKRLNRNALIVAAVLMGFTVLTAVVVLNPGREMAGGAQSGTAPGPGRPTFLDEPVHAESLANPIPRPSPVPAPGAATPWERSSPPGGTEVDLRGGAGPATAREQAFEAALKSPALPGGSEVSAATELGRSRREAVSAEDRLIALGDSLTRAAEGGTDKEETPTTRARDFLTKAGNVGGGSVIARLEPAGSRYTLRAGTVVPGVLLTGINSDLPGEIVGQVSRDVYDSRTQRILLVPKGAKLIGTYDNQVAAGQGRLLVAWTRLILPDGRSLTLPGLPLKDPQGQSGAADGVDHHYRRVFGNALLLSAISAGAQLSQPRQTSILAAPSAGQVAAGALGQELSNVAVEILRRGMDVAPTITIRQGHPFLVFLNGDLVFDGPYEPEP